MATARQRRLAAVAAALCPALPRLPPCKSSAAAALSPGDAQPPAAVLSPAELAAWERDGVVIVKRAVPRAVTAGIRRDIRALLELGPEGTREGWWRRPEGVGGRGGLELYQTQAQWEARAAPRVYGAFAQIWGRRDLHCSIAPCHFREPLHAAHPGFGGGLRLHWDRSRELWRHPGPLRAGIQAVLHLADTPAHGGGWKGVPGFHRLFEDPQFAERLQDWQPEQADGSSGRTKSDRSYVELPEARAAGLVERVYAGEDGDMLVWNALVPHGTEDNSSSQPRQAQYLNVSKSEPRSISDAI